jgi:hypothetical protein
VLTNMLPKGYELTDEEVNISFDDFKAKVAGFDGMPE